MNEKILNAAQVLADLLAQSEEITELQRARDAYMHNDALMETAKEYMIQSAALQEEMGKGDDADKDVMIAIKDKMVALGSELNASEDFLSMKKAETEAGELLNAVNAILSRAISGEEEGECSHDCSHCSGCH